MRLMDSNRVQLARTAGLGFAIVALAAASIGLAGSSLDRHAVQNRQNAPATLTERVNATLGLLQSKVVEIDLAGVLAAPDTLTVPVADRLITMELWPHSVRGGAYSLWTELEDGSVVEVEPGPSHTVRGEIVGEAGSSVAGSIHDDGVFLSIVFANGDNYWIEPLNGRVDGARPESHVVYSSCDVIPDGASCGVTEMMMMQAWQPPPGDEGVDEGGIAGAICKVAELAADADFQFYQLYGNNVTNVENRINAVINTVNQQYENQVGIVHEIVFIIVRTSAGSNPYSSNNAGTLLCQFRNHWNANHTSVQRDIAHLFTGRNLGNTLGIAWLGVICNVSFNQCGGNGNNGYSLVRNRTNFSCATDLSAHELGHNWNAQHCSCPSHTMNPSITCANNFTDGTRNTIVAFRNSRWCLHDCLPPGPENDTCQHSMFVSEGVTPFTNIGATTDGPNESTLCTFGGDSQVQKDVWFAYLTECTGDLTISLCGSSFPTKLAVYTGFCPAQPNTAIACDLSGCPSSSRSEVTIPVTQGQAIRIRVGGHLGAEGNGQLTITCAASAPDCAGDLDDSGAVDVQDLLILLGAWGPNAGHPADLDDSGAVDVQDLLILLGAWGPCP